MPEDQIVDVENPVVRNVIRICRVPDSLSKEKPDPYKPVEVSIGPYHKDDPHLQPMQHHKERYLESLIKRRNNFLKQRNPQSVENEDTCWSKLNEIKSEARECYDKSSIENSTSGVDFLESDEFVTMMLLDGCFVVEFLRKMYCNVYEEVLSDEDGPAPKDQSKIYRLLCDMMLAENQLPYFVITNLYDMTKCGEQIPLEEMAVSCFNILLPRPRLYFSSLNVGEIQSKPDKIDHLLHLVYIFCCPSPAYKISIKHRVIGESLDDQTRGHLLDRQNIERDRSHEIKNQMPMGTVIKLQDAGIKFERVGIVYDGSLKRGIKDDYVSLFDLEYKHGQMIMLKRGRMKVPCFKVDASTEILLRNLIAYEQTKQCWHIEHKYFTDFAFLMNELIESEDDVEELRSNNIIKSFFENNGDVSQLFNMLTYGINESDRPYYHEVQQKAIKHCESKCNRQMEQLRRRYFVSPWALISALAGVFLLCLAVGQTVIALISLVYQLHND